eukprot:CAMPEP_0206602724 /NCGR_PEP_ID=MMETSP0325_2-20121206/47665_1 /ASSEMBLY_ACC=CAM_ASM_000347 /TAXON_ID=2866 /ORGANISM="Crypthecodinium cohnii, Strain Seligo" /LENGTH=67 /DNA_ID=CAMNT_0054115481 /DNA_START=105 /DNA_END=305 /DNA_ORIENTATION=+
MTWQHAPPVRTCLLFDNAWRLPACLPVCLSKEATSSSSRSCPTEIIMSLGVPSVGSVACCTERKDSE